MNWLLVKQLGAGRCETISLFADVSKMILQQLNVSHQVDCNTRSGSCITISMENATDIGLHPESMGFVIHVLQHLYYVIEFVLRFR